MQNKPNFQKAQMNVSNIITRNYQIFLLLAGQKNKPNSNPIKPNFQKAKMNVNSLITKDYRNNDDLRLTQPIRAAHPFDEILLYNCRESSTNQPFYAKQTQFQKKSNERKSI